MIEIQWYSNFCPSDRRWTHITQWQN